MSERCLSAGYFSFVSRDYVISRLETGSCGQRLLLNRGAVDEPLLLLIRVVSGEFTRDSEQACPVFRDLVHAMASVRPEM